MRKYLLSEMTKLEFARPDGIIENIEAFFTAVDITEKFNVFLVSFHVFFAALIIATRNYQNMQLFILSLLLLLCFLLEKINQTLSENWKNITTQNYFDESGFFVCVMIGFPALCNCVLIMANSLVNTFKFLISNSNSKLKKTN